MCTGSRISIILLSILLQLSALSQDLPDYPTLDFETGNQFLLDGSYLKAFEFFQNKILESEKNNDLNAWIEASMMTAQSLILLGQVTKAISLLNDLKDLDLIKSNNSWLVEREILMAEAYLKMGRPDLTIELLEPKIKDLSNIDHQQQAKILTVCGLANWNLGNYNKSKDYLSETLTIQESLFGQESITVASTLNNLGLVHSAEKPELALELYQDALSIYRKHYGESHPKIANTITNIAIIQKNIGELSRSISTFNQALDINRKYFGETHSTIGFILSSIGSVYLELKQFDIAKSYQDDALALYKKIYGERHQEIAGIFNQLGIISLSAGNPEIAIEYFESALTANRFQSGTDISKNQPFDNFINPDLYLATLHWTSLAYEDVHAKVTLLKKDLILALTLLQTCDTLINQIRQIRTKESDKIALSKTASEVYEDALRICSKLINVSVIKKPYLELAFYFIERSKNSTLKEAIAHTEAKNFAGLPQQVLESERKLSARLSFLNEQIISSESDTVIQNLKSELLQTEIHYQEFIKTIERNFPKYYNLKISNRIPTVQELQQKLDPQEAILNYFLAQNDQVIYLSVIDKNKTTLYDIPLTEDLGRSVLGLRNAITFKSTQTIKILSHKLFKLLIPDKIIRYRQLVVIPDGVLNMLPFEILLVKNSKGDRLEEMPFLINKMAVSYSYAASLLLNKHNPIKSPIEQIHLFAPVDFSSLEGIVLNELPYSKFEAEQIKKIFDSINLESKTYIGTQASEHQLKSIATSKFDIVHLATHGKVDLKDPRKSQIYLVPDTLEDGALHPGEIYNHELNFTLMVLSACETGLGKIAKGEGVIGLTRALLYAGVENMIVSLWPVSDQSTSELMTGFYNELLKQRNRGFAHAFQKAKIHLLQNPKFSHPYYWSGFILIGR